MHSILVFKTSAKDSSEITWHEKSTLSLIERHNCDLTGCDPESMYVYVCVCVCVGGGGGGYFLITSQQLGYHNELQNIITNGYRFSVVADFNISMDELAMYTAIFAWGK